MIDRLRTEYIAPKNKLLRNIHEDRRLTIVQDDKTHIIKFGDDVAAEIWQQNPEEIYIKIREFDCEDSNENIIYFTLDDGKFDYDAIFYLLTFQIAGELPERVTNKMIALSQEHIRNASPAPHQ